MDGFSLPSLNDFGSLPLFNWVGDLWNVIITIIPTSVDFIAELISRINAVEFNTSFVAVTHFLGVIRFLIGDVNYFLIMGSLYIGCGFLFYRLINKLVDLIQQIFNKTGLNSFIKIFRA